MTEVTSWIGRVAFFACFAFMLYGVVWRIPSRGESVKPGWGTLLLLATLECAALWCWFALAFPLLAWAFWIGDNEHWFFGFAWVFAGVIAIAATSLATWRWRNFGLTATDRRIQVLVPLLLLISFGVASTYESLHTVAGLTASAAAQQTLDQLSPAIQQPVRFVEAAGEPPYGLDPARCKSYWILGDDEPRGRFTLCRHRWFGWQVAHRELFPPSEQELGQAKRWLADSTNRDRAILVLRSVVTNYPQTPAEAEAKELLRSIGATPSRP